MTTTKKPTIVLVPGAWHPASCFDLIASSLQFYGYETIQVTTPSVGSSEPFSADVQAIRDAIRTASKKGEVLLFMHSYGGVPGCCAIEGLRKEDLPEGGVTSLVFCTSWMLDVGETILANPIVNPRKARAVSDDPLEVWKPRGGATHCFYGDLSPEDQEMWIARLRHQKFDTIMKSPVTYAAWKSVPTTYILCTKDEAIGYETQLGLVERAGKEGIHVKTERLEASHSPFLSMPEAVVEAIRRAALETN